MMETSGIGSASASLIVSAVGVSNMAGRVLVGLLVDRPWVSALLVHNVSLAASGVVVASFPFCVALEEYLTLGVALGFSAAPFISLTSVVLVDLLGLDSLTSAFGLLIAFRGTSAVLGPPLAGAVYDANENADNRSLLP